MKSMVYEVLNVAHEVIFEGSAPECLKYCEENEQKASGIREKNEKGGQILLPVSLWMPMAKRIQAYVSAQEDKKTKKEEKKKWRKKEKISSKSVRAK